MSEENGEDTGWLETAVRDGLPRMLAGPAGAAVSRLIGAGVEIPAAWLETKSQAIRDKAADRRALESALASKATELTAEDPALVERAKQALLGKEYRRQQNKEAVAQIALQELKGVGEEQVAAEPSEDWMNKFERYAEDASSEDLRLLFGKLLAGEISHANSVSLSTLHFVSILTHELAALIERALPNAMLAGGIVLDALEPKFNTYEMSVLTMAGFFVPDRSFPVALDEEGTGAFYLSKSARFLVVGSPNAKITVPVAILSGPGEVLLQILSPKQNIEGMARVLKDKGAKHVQLATLIEGGGKEVITEVL